MAEQLADGEKCVRELAEHIRADFSTVSRHLSVLRGAGVVEDEKRGKLVYYRLKVPSSSWDFAKQILPLLLIGVFIAGAFMYFVTLTEVPILQGLMGSGMGKGPALALLLAGPALSLPNMLVIRNVPGTKKTLVFISLVVTMATISGMLFGTLF